jgi:DNA-binding NtrC family response regulator
MSDLVGNPSIVLIEDSSDVARCYSEFLKGEFGDIISLSSGVQAIGFFESTESPAIVLLDLRLKDVDGVVLLKHIRRASPGSAIITINNQGAFDVSREVIQLGAADYLEKPFTRDRICLTVRNALNALLLYRKANPYKHGYYGFIGSCPAMQRVYKTIELAAASDASVFITGENGTGKDICAMAIHSLSRRNTKDCVILNCAAIPENLIESEIFGHVKGSFTGANVNREGAASRAHQSTLFLDEIGDMNVTLQSKLLRFVQTGQFNVVGSSLSAHADIRFICATNKNPLDEIKNKSFREDLYYRLNVIPIHLPPLRERGNDIIEIAEHHLKIFSKQEGKSFRTLSSKVKNIFLNYDWPGNIRQLLNVVRNVVVLHEGVTVEAHMLPSPFNSHSVPLSVVAGAGAGAGIVPETSITCADVLTATAQQPRRRQFFDLSIAPDTPDSIIPLWKLELLAIDHALQLCDGNVTHAAKCLEINPSTIHRKRLLQQKNAG